VEGTTAPPRVKVYGLFPLTRRRYLKQAVAGVFCLLVVLAAWWLGWPDLRQRLVRVQLPPAMALTVAVLDNAPWILLAALLYKAGEVYCVLRLFARKEAQRAAAPFSPKP
jgi:hypothetical protein